MLFFALAAFAPDKARSICDGLYTERPADRRPLIYDPKCAECHGDDLEGDVVEAPALAGSEFLWKFNGVTIDHVFTRIHRDMPLTKSGTVSKEATAEIIAYMLRVSDLPAGKTELPNDESLLRQIRIDAEKPR